MQTKYLLYIYAVLFLIKSYVHLIKCFEPVSYQDLGLPVNNDIAL